ANCASCGKALVEDMRFCPYCGQVVSSEDMEHFEPVKGEVVTAVASPAHIVGRDGTYAVAFTDERLIFALIGSFPRDKIKGDFLQAGIFLPGSSSTSNVSRFYEMTPDEVIAEMAGNFFLMMEDVGGVKLSYESDEALYIVTLRMGEGSLVLTLPYEKYFRDLLFRAFEGRMSW
ncbi:MAG: zinc ribbon domain-containing protein, partial [Methanomassiliicoccales archaeon]|nr:zinc ribbon domain-containing protein [Methanomassiliicoccales archaeon]